MSPPNAPQTVVAQPVSPSPKLDPADQNILALLRQGGRYGLPVWKLLDQAPASHNPSSRSERRSLRLEFWGRLKRLLHVGMAHRFARKDITATKLPRMSVSRRGRTRSGSTIVESPSPAQQTFGKSLVSNLLLEDQAMQASNRLEQNTESAKARTGPGSPQAGHINGPRQANIRFAAESLALLPRGVKRRLSGYVGSVRPRVGQPIRLADGTEAFFGGAKRGQVLFFRDADHHMEQGRWGFVRAIAVTVLKNESAIMLGRLKKGRTEKPSSAKQQAARTNGKCATKPGRKRGRPRTRW